MVRSNASDQFFSRKSDSGVMVGRKGRKEFAFSFLKLCIGGGWKKRGIFLISQLQSVSGKNGQY